MAKCKSPSCNNDTYGDPSGFCFRCKKQLKSTKSSTSTAKPPRQLAKQSPKPKPLRPTSKHPSKPISKPVQPLPTAKEQPRRKPPLPKTKHPTKPKLTGAPKIVSAAKGKEASQKAAPKRTAPVAQPSVPKKQAQKQPDIPRRNTVDIPLPPIVFVQTRFSWLGYEGVRADRNTISAYIPALEKAVQKKPGGQGFAFTFRVLQKDEKKTPTPSVKNVDLDLTCSKYVDSQRKPLAQGKAATKPGESTDTPFADFMGLFYGDSGVLTPIGRRLFAVTDANYAHNVAAAVAHKAFSDFTGEEEHKGKKRVIINFDQHEDCGVVKKASDVIRCNNWGGFCLQTGKEPCKNAIADVYIVIGVGTGTTKTAEHAYRDRTLGNKAVSATGDDGIDTVIGQIKDGDWENSLVFATVDRDFFIGNGTPWGDGIYMPEAGRKQVKDTLSSLKNKGATFVGFEVSGIPERTGIDVYKKAKRASQMKLGTKGDDFLDRLAADIAFFWKLFNEELT